MKFDPACDVISDVQTKFCNILEKFKPGAMKCYFRIEDRFISLADSVGGEAVPSPLARPPLPPTGGPLPLPTGGQGPKIPPQGAGYLIYENWGNVSGRLHVKI